MKENIFNLIPIAAHYDESTLITKNGELVQIIEITGFTKRFQSKSTNIRDEIRLLLQSLVCEDLMFYLYVARDYQTIDLSTNDLHLSKTSTIHKLWITDNHLSTVLMNTLYIVTVHKGSKELFNLKHFFYHFSLKKIKKSFTYQLNNALKTLSNVSMKIFENFEKYGIKLLTIIQEKNEYISQPLSFMHYILHGYKKDIILSEIDFAKLLVDRIDIQKYNSNILCFLKIDDNATKEPIVQSYAAMLTFKSIYNLALEYTDSILSVDFKILVVETVKSTKNQEFIKELNLMHKAYEYVNMNTSVNIIDNFLESDKKNGLINTQVSIKFIANTTEELINNLNKMQNILNNIGISSILEDYYSFSSLLAILPGNSHLLKRENINTINQVGNLSSIKLKALSGYDGSIWGQAVTVFRTIEGATYFFNFHDSQNVGHTIIIGNKSCGAEILISFLIAESLKFNIQLVNLMHNQYDKFYYHNEDLNIVFSVDLLSLINKDVKLLYEIICLTLKSLEHSLRPLQNEVIELLKAILNLSSINKKNVEKIIQSTEITLNSDIKDGLLEFFSEKCFFKLMHQNNLKYSMNIYLYDYIKVEKLKYIEEQNVASIITLLCLMQVDNDFTEDNIQPIIMHIGSEVLLLQHVLRDKFMDLLNKLSKKHTVIIISCYDRKLLYQTQGLDQVVNLIPNKFFLSDKFVDKKFQQIFNLSYNDMNTIKMYSPNDYIVLLKHEDYTIVASFKALYSIEKVI